MDTEDLHGHLRELAATAAVDASADRGEIENRADLYRRHRRRVASTFTALGIAVVLIVLIVVANSGNDGQSVRVPPAQSSDTATATTIPDPIRSVDECLAQHGVARGTPDAGTINVDDLTLGPTTMDLRQYCTEQVALAPPTDDVLFSTYVDGGHVKARYYERVTKTLPDGFTEVTQGRELTPVEVQDLFARTATSTTVASESTTSVTDPTSTTTPSAAPSGRYYYDGPCPDGQVPSPVLAPPDCLAAKN